MVTEEVNRRIRQLVLDGKLSAEEARSLTDAMDVGETGPQVPAPIVVASAPSPTKATNLAIRVEEHGESVVDVKFPLAMAQLAWPMVSKYLGSGVFPANFNVTQFHDLLVTSGVGPIMDVQAEGYHIVMRLE